MAGKSEAGQIISDFRYWTCPPSGWRMLEAGQSKAEIPPQRGMLDDALAARVNGFIWSAKSFFCSFASLILSYV